MSYLTHLLLATILLPYAFLLEERVGNKEVLTVEDKEVLLANRDVEELINEDEEMLINHNKEVLIVTGGFSSQGALSSVEVLSRLYFFQ